MAAGSLPRAAGDYFTLVQLIGRAPEGVLPDVDSLRHHLRRQLDELRRLDDIPAEEIDEARFALAAWADEVIMGSGWSGAAQWSGHSLQMELFATSKAGKEFFDHLARLRPDQNDAREVYCLVLGLGFQGLYAGQEAERRALISTQYDTLRAAGRVLETQREKRLTPTAYQLDVDIGRRSGGVVRYLLLMVLGCALAYGVLWAVLGAVTGTVPTPVGG